MRGETARYQPLVNTLNSILRWNNSNPDVIFLVNDTATIIGPDLPTKRKPDIILVSLPTLRSWLGDTCDHYNFNDCVSHLSKKPIPKHVKRSWIEIIQFWELKATMALEKRAKEIHTVHYSIGSIREQTRPLHSSSKSTPLSEGSAISAINSSAKSPTGLGTSMKRKGETSSDPNNVKKSRNSHIPSQAVEDSSLSWDAPGFSTSVTPDVQCAYYAIEHFRSSWKISHVSGVYLKGEKYVLHLETTDCTFVNRFNFGDALVRLPGVYQVYFH